MPGEFLTEQEVLDRWGISRAELSGLVEEGSLTVIERAGRRGFARDQVLALEAKHADLRETAARMRPEEAGEKPEGQEELAETVAAPRAGSGEELEEDDLFDFAEELETELSEEPKRRPAAQPAAAKETPEEADEEAEMITEVVDVSGLEGGEEDLLGDVIEDVSAELEPQTAAPAGEATQEMEPAQEPTAEITDLEGETVDTEAGATEEVTADLTRAEEGFEDQELEEILATEEAAEAAEEEFEVPEAAAVPAEVPVPVWAAVVLVLVVVVQIVAGLFVVENAVSPRYATGITRALSPFKGD